MLFDKNCNKLFDNLIGIKPSVLQKYFIIKKGDY
jgi:hypothetical protein